MEQFSSVFRGRFVGREPEQQLWEEILAAPGNTPRVLFFVGPGGIGKSWLIRLLLDQAKGRPGIQVLQNPIDMYSHSNRHPEGVMDTIVCQLPSAAAPGGFESYAKAKRELEKARQLGPEEYSEEGIRRRLQDVEQAFHSCLEQTAQGETVVLALDTFENVQNGPVRRWVLSEDGLLLPGVICLIGSRIPLEDADPAEPISVHRLAELTDEQSLDFFHKYQPSVLGLDTPARSRAAGLEEYISSINKMAAGNPLFLGMALLWLSPSPGRAGRLEELDQNQFEQAIVSWLHPVTGSATLHLGGRDLDEPMRQTLVCMAYLNRRFNRSLLNTVVAQGYVRPRGITVDQIWDQLQRREPDFFFVKERPEEEVQLHDKLAEMIRKHLLPTAFRDLDATGGKVAELSKTIVEWYDEQIAAPELDDTRRDVLRAEMLAYVLQIDILSDLRTGDFDGAKELYSLFQLDWERAKALLAEYEGYRSDILDRLILDEMWPQIVEQFPEADQYNVYATLGRIANRAYLHDLARDHWKSAAAVAQRLENPEQHVRALIGQFNSTWQIDPLASIPVIDRALELCGQAEHLRPLALYEKGFAYSMAQNPAEAIRWYGQARTAVRQQRDATRAATILNDLGFEYVRLGRYREAEAVIKAARQARYSVFETLREALAEAKEQLQAALATEDLSDLEAQVRTLEDQVRDAELRVGMTYNTLGDMMRYEGDEMLLKAEGYYDQAQEIFDRVRNPWWQVQAFHSRGEARRRFAMVRYRAHQEESANQYDKNAFEDIEASLALCEQYGFYQTGDTAHRRMGRLLHDRALRSSDPDEQMSLLDRALEHFEQGLYIAQETGDVYEEMMNLTEIAFLADDRVTFMLQRDPDRREEAEKQGWGYINQLRDGIAQHESDEPQIFQFPVFENLLEIELGAFHYALSEFDVALEHYVLGYVGMARDPGYGSARYHQHVDHLFDNIRRLGNAQLVEHWCNQFVGAWKQEHVLEAEPSRSLAEAHPEFLSGIEACLDTAFIYA